MRIRFHEDVALLAAPRGRRTPCPKRLRAWRIGGETSECVKQLIKAIIPSRIWNRVRDWRYMHDYRRAIERFHPRAVTHRFCGVELTVHISDPVGEHWYDHDWPDELEELRLLSDHRLKEGARVFDIGAHQGVIALVVAHRVGPRGSVLAVEANPHNVAVARRNVQANGARNITVVHAAAAATAGELTMNELLNGRVDTSGSRGAFRVRSVSLDELGRQHGRPDVVKLDVEGFEVDVLRGSTETLSGPTDWFVEVHAGTGLEDCGGSVDQVLSYFANGFDCYAAAATDSELTVAFLPLGAASVDFRQRFYLVAIRQAN